MLCHKSTGDKPVICAGWAAVEGFAAIGLRLAAMRGRYNPDGLDVEGVGLYSSMREMIQANNNVYVAQGQPPVRLPVDK